MYVSYWCGNNEKKSFKVPQRICFLHKHSALNKLVLYELLFYFHKHWTVDILTHNRFEKIIATHDCIFSNSSEYSQNWIEDKSSTVTWGMFSALLFTPLCLLHVWKQKCHQMCSLLMRDVHFFLLSEYYLNTVWKLLAICE